ncbi:MAG: hypothetical protein ACI4EG_11405 [Fusicatenibacter sp.]
MNNNTLLKTVISLAIAAIAGALLLGWLAGYMGGAIIALLIYGIALIVDAIRDLKR